MTTKTLLALAICTLAGCAPPGVVALRQAQGDTFGASQRSRVILNLSKDDSTKTPIKHVIFIVQENRSFNNLFMGFPGATTAKYGYDQYGKKIKIRPRDLGAPWDLGHDSGAFFAACDGTGKLPGTDCKMDGWNGEGADQGAPPNPAYSYVPQDEITPYWTLAKQYVLADNTFASNLDGSFVAHQYIVAAFSSHAVDFPFGVWGCNGGSGDKVTTLTGKRAIGPSIAPCFTNPTIASEADAAGIGWHFYAGPITGDGGIWSSYQADEKIVNGPDWKEDVVSPPSRFLKDVAKGKLANVTWITPTFETSDQPGIKNAHGPAWVASVVNAIGESKFWNSCAIFLFWDDWGGMFDPVNPVFEDYDGLGFRVPLIIISPYAEQGSVTHVQYETASVLRFMEDNFGLAPLAKADARASDFADDPAAFDYAQKPRKFKKIAGSEPLWYWMQLERSSARRAAAAILGDD
ncbi:MAG: alkaline phosphatase family protein [Candidatus Cybelea sp.]